MAYKWGLLQKDVHMRIPGAKQKLENFRRERMTLVGEVLEVIGFLCLLWYTY
jgi:hypothetical protein